MGRLKSSAIAFSAGPETDNSNANIAIIASVSVLFLLFIAAILFFFQKKRASSRVRVPERTCEDVNPVYGDYSYPDPTAEVEDSYHY